MIELMINAMFTGIGTATGLALFELFLKPRIHSINERAKRMHDRLREVIK